MVKRLTEKEIARREREAKRRDKYWQEGEIRHLVCPFRRRSRKESGYCNPSACGKWSYFLGTCPDFTIRSHLDEIIEILQELRAEGAEEEIKP